MVTKNAAVADNAHPAKKPIPVLRGLKDIGTALDVSSDTVHRYAVRREDPLPLVYDHAGRVSIRMDVLHDWMDRNTIPYKTYQKLAERGLLPSQQGQVEKPTKHPRNGRGHRRPMAVPPPQDAPVTTPATTGETT